MGATGIKGGCGEAPADEEEAAALASVRPFVEAAIEVLVKLREPQVRALQYAGLFERRCDSC